MSVSPGNLWKFMSYVLFSGVIITGALNMLEVRGGFATNYLADIIIPPLLYINTVKLLAKRFKVLAYLSEKPLLTAILIFAGSTFTEICQIFWPRGIFSGYFDPWDIAAFSSGLIVVYTVDKLAG
jgi:hypothetical protein